MKRWVIVAWVALLVTTISIWLQSGVRLTDIPELLDDALAEMGLAQAAGIYILLYVLRPLIFFPAALLTLASGMIFGPWLGIAFTIVGENLSANAAFLFGRWLGTRERPSVAAGLLKRWDRRLTDNAMVSVLLMRLTFLPFDAINFGCGLTSMRQRDFFVGTFLGILPAVFSLSLLGGSTAAGIDNRPVIVGMGVLALLIGIGIARWLRGRTPASAGL